MIYSPNNNKPLVLTESDADSFLESVGVELYEDSISIDGMIYEGYYGESILESNGILLYEDGIVLEGEAAEKHKAMRAAERRKAEEEKEREDNKFQTTRLTAGMKHPERVDGKLYVPKEDYLRHRAANSMVYDELDRRQHKYEKSGSYEDLRNYGNLANNMGKARDKQNKHMRKHYDYYKKKYGKKSTNESTIFSDIEII